MLDGGSAVRRTAAAAWPILQQTAAAGLAWAVAVAVLDHPSPFFAPIAAVIGLNEVPGRRGSNAVRLLIGVVVGIVVGELAVAVAGGGVWTLTGATFTAMVIAQLIDGARIVTAQAAVSAILITAFGDPSQGVNRLVEALIGGSVALVFSQLVFSPDPLRLLRRAEMRVLTAMADGLRLTADALERDDPELADLALTRLRGLRDRCPTSAPCARPRPDRAALGHVALTEDPGGTRAGERRPARPARRELRDADPHGHGHHSRAAGGSGAQRPEAGPGVG